MFKKCSIICILLLSLFALTFMTKDLVVNAAAADGITGSNTSNNVLYAGKSLLNHISMPGTHNKQNVVYDSSSQTIRITATATDSDPQLMFDVSSLNIGSSSDPISAYDYVVITYRCSKVDTTYMFLMPDAYDAQAYRSVRFNTIKTTSSTHTSSHDDFHVVKIKISSMITNALGSNTEANKKNWENANFTKLTKFRFDYFTTINVGDWFELDSIGFFKEETNGKNSAGYLQWERETIRNNYGTFKANNYMQYMFYDNHNVNTSYDSSQNAIKLTMNKTCTNAYPHSNGRTECDRFDSATPKGIFDPMARFHMHGGIEANYRYVILTYMTPNTKEEIMYSTGSYTPPDYQKNKGYIPVGVYPLNKNNQEIQSYIRDFPIYQKDVWYTRYIDLQDSQQGEMSYQLRIDPFDYSYVYNGAVLYIKSIIFTDDLSKVKDEIANEFLYSYEIEYNSNVPSSDTSVSGMPSDQTFIHGNNTLYEYEFTISQQKPTRTDYTFVGWSESPDGDVLTTNKITLTGIENQLVVKTLYAIWQLNIVYINYQLSTPITGVENYPTLSVTRQSVGVTDTSPLGTTLTLTPGYKLDGWYNEAGSKVSSELNFKPTKSSDVWTEQTFTAKIIYEEINITSSIVEDKVYNLFTTSKKSIDILQNSSFTISLTLNNYYPNVHECVSLINFSEALPNKAKILMIDITNTNQTKYFSYQSNGAQNSLKLSDFVNIQDNSSYSDNKVSSLKNKKLLFIFDLSKTTINVGSYKVEFEKSPITSAVKDSLTYNIFENRVYDFVDLSTSSLEYNDKIDLTYQLNASTIDGIDTFNSNCQYSLIIKLKNNANLNIEFMKGSYIIYNNIKYFSNDKMQIIIPLNDPLNTNINLRFESPYEKILNSNYKFVIMPYISATSDGYNPNGGQKISEIETAFTCNNQDKAIKIDLPSNNHLITKTSGKAGFNIYLDTLNIDRNSLVLSIEKFDNDNWTTINDVILNNVDFNSVTDTFILKLDTDKLNNYQTYRIVLKSNNSSIQDEIMIIITE